MAEVSELAMTRMTALEKEVAELKKALEAFDQIVLASPSGKYRMRLRQRDDGSLVATLLVWKEESRTWEPQGTSGEGEKVLALTDSGTVLPVRHLR